MMCCVHSSCESAKLMKCEGVMEKALLHRASARIACNSSPTVRSLDHCGKSYDLRPKTPCAQGRLVSDLQKELEECRAEMGAQDSAMAAMVQQHDMARASASDSIDRSKVQCPITVHCRTACNLPRPYSQGVCIYHFNTGLQSTNWSKPCSVP